MHYLRENTMSESKTDTALYKRIGGEAAIRAAVDRMPRLKAHQFAFLSQALGGPKQAITPLSSQVVNTPTPVATA